MENKRIIISGGGTGGHIFPAISIANALKEIAPDTEILFVGAQGRMEMQKVPKAGYPIKGLPIRGLMRPLWKLQNIGVLIDYLKSSSQAKKLIKEFKPHVAVGVGGYASSATLNAASKLGVPCLIQEQNSYPGLTNRSLAHKVEKICVAYDGLERFFPKEKILLTGNPVRQNLMNADLDVAECRKNLNLKSGYPTLLVIGGSLGARTINEAILEAYDYLAERPIQVIWQTGEYYYSKIKENLSKRKTADNIVVMDFITHMDQAYKVADLVISRAGASSISELSLLGKPTIFVPSPNVAEDHQTHNAMALVKKNAALLVRDQDASKELVKTAVSTLQSKTLLQELGENARKMAFTDSAQTIAKEILKMANR